MTALLLAALAAAGTPAPKPPPLPAPGTHQLEHEGVKYVLYMPTIPAEKKAPLVVALHYAGTVTPWYAGPMMDQLYVPALGAAGAVVIAPDCPAVDWLDSSAESQVLALVDHAVATLPIDPDRVVLSGFSAGAVGAWAIASHHPDRFSALIPIAGSPSQATSGVEEVAVFALHATTDTVLPYAPTKTKIDSLHTSGHVAKMVLVSGPTHYQLPGYTDLLRGTVPWLAEQWKAQAAQRAAEAAAAANAALNAAANPALPEEDETTLPSVPIDLDDE